MQTQVQLTKIRKDGKKVKVELGPRTHSEANILYMIPLAELVKKDPPKCKECDGAGGSFLAVGPGGRERAWFGCPRCRPTTTKVNNEIIFRHESVTYFL